MTQTTIDGETLDTVCSIATSGRVIRPWKQMITQTLQGRGDTTEYRLKARESGLQVQMVDSANVILIESEIPASVFDEYSISDDVNFGVSNEILGSLFQHARYGKSTDDTIQLTGSQEELQSVVSRELHGVGATFRESQALIDPKSIREEPNLPDLNLTTTVDLPVRTFIDAIDALDGEYMEFVINDELVIQSETDVSHSEITLDAAIDGEPVEVLFSMDYCERIIKALHVGKVDVITLNFRSDYPILIEFEREEVYSGHIMLSPRLKGDDV